MVAMSAPEVDRPPIAWAPISLLLPLHNEEAMLKGVVNAWVANLDRLERDYEIILVDDGSTDGTASLAAWHGHIRLLRHTARRGLGAALRTGLQTARHPLLLI